VSTHRPEVADVFRSYGAAYEREYGSSTSKQQKRVLRELALCRTEALGGHKYKCDCCGHERISYNSCRNRHCPKCQASARAQWLEARCKDLLNVPYFHVVFTVPEQLGLLALQNKRLVYAILFRAASQTLITIAKDPKHFGADIGFLTVLHTWGQNLLHHPHLHCVVPGGGISSDGQNWMGAKQDFFLPVRVLSRLFRGKFLAYLQEAYDNGRLRFYGRLKGLSNKTCWKKWLGKLYSQEWVVYAKPPFGGPEQVLKYLARYTHRVAISNRRLVSLEDGKITFRWKDYSQGNRPRTMTLDALEFIRRLLLHVLPSGFMHIRYYGIFANGHRRKKLAVVRKLLADKQSAPLDANDTSSMPTHLPGGDDDFQRCPVCKQGRLLRVETIQPSIRARADPYVWNTS
jgi:hypothetical protein